MPTAEIEFLEPLIEALHAVHAYQERRPDRNLITNGDASEIKAAISGFITDAAHIGTFEEQVEFFDAVAAHIPAFIKKGKEPYFLVDTLFGTLLASSRSHAKALSLTRGEEYEQIQIYALKKLAPYIKDAIRKGPGINVQERTYITKEFCLVTNAAALMKSEEDVLSLYDGDNKPIPVNFNADIQPLDEEILAVARIFTKVSAKEIKPSEAAQEITDELGWKPKTIFAYDTV